MELKLGGTYRARNGKVITLEMNPTSYYIERPFMDEHIFCADFGLMTWKPDGKYSAVSVEVPHGMDLVEEITNYRPTAVEAAQLLLSQEEHKQDVKELEESLVISLSKKDLMFLAGLVGGLNPHKSLATVRGTYSAELWGNSQWKPFVRSLTHLYPYTLYNKLVGLVESLEK